MTELKSVNCCYNCKYFCKTFYLGDVWICMLRKRNNNICNDYERVEPNNICDKWNRREEWKDM